MKGVSICTLGLASGLYPYLVPWSVMAIEAASDSLTLVFMMLGIGPPDPGNDHLQCLSVHGLSRKGDRAALRRLIEDSSDSEACLSPGR
jgi:hypothetical protein